MISTTTVLDADHRQRLGAAAARLRRHSLTSTAAAGSGHPTSSLSCADLVAALFFGAMRYDVAHPDNPANDRFVLSKGHAAPVLWAALAEAGAFPVADLAGLRQIDSPLEGHPTPRCPWVDVATGSLGQGLSVGAGMAWFQRLRGIDSRVWVLLGDGELAEGSVWEAAAVAGHYGLDKLCAIVDVNRLGQTGETMLGHDIAAYAARFESFGWRSITIDGHDLEAVIEAYRKARATDDRPTAIIARTVKGKGVSFLEDENGRHGKALSGEELERALAEVGEPDRPRDLGPLPPEVATPPPLETPHAGGEFAEVEDDAVGIANYHQPTATRDAYGAALRAALERDERLVVLDAEVSDSTRSGQAEDLAPRRFLECFIAEQNMIGMAMGCAALGAVPCCSTFASFLARAYDQLRMAAISKLHLVVAGSHAGVSIGEDGPSQMGLEDLAMFRALPGSTVLCPADAVACERLVEIAIDQPGVVYLRLARPATPIIHEAARDFQVGGSHVLRRSDGDAATVIACGVCVDAALRAADHLIDNGVGLRVIDAYSIKPLDRATIRAAAADTGRVVVVEDHYAEGGLGDAVAQAVAGIPCQLRHLAVRQIPRSGAKAELLERHGIGRKAIGRALEELLSC